MVQEEPAPPETLSPRRVVGDGRTPLGLVRPRPSTTPKAQIYDLASNDSVEDVAEVTQFFINKKKSTHGAILLCATWWSTGECRETGCPHSQSRPRADVAPSPVRVPITSAVVNNVGGTSGLKSSSWGIIPSLATPVAIPEDPTPKIEAYQLETASRIQLFGNEG